MGFADVTVGKLLTRGFKEAQSLNGVTECTKILSKGGTNVKYLFENGKCVRKFVWTGPRTTAYQTNGITSTVSNGENMYIRFRSDNHPMNMLQIRGSKPLVRTTMKYNDLLRVMGYDKQSRIDSIGKIFEV